jgi:hypothetical protein
LNARSNLQNTGKPAAPAVTEIFFPDEDYSDISIQSKEAFKIEKLTGSFHNR